jgi:hypothetical protein
LVIKKFKYNEFNLGEWVSHQRTAKDRLTTEQFSRLDELGFSWDPHQDRWNIGFKNLIAYEDQFGHCLVPFSYKYNDFNLGQWVDTQRRFKDKLTTERFNQLEHLGFVWKAK